MSSSLYSFFAAVTVLLLFLPSFAEPQLLLCTPDTRMSFSLEDSSELYLHLENALVEDNSALLDQLRASFLTDVMDEVIFELDIKVVNSPQYICKTSDKTLYYNDYSFCDIENPVNHASQLCQGPLLFQYFAPSAFKRASLRSTNIFVTWATLVHGNWFSLLLNLIIYGRQIPEHNIKFVTITLNLDRLHCNPTYGLLLCNVNDLFSWIKLYSEGRGMDKIWNRNHKGTTTLNSEAYGFDVREITDWVPDTDTLLNLCLTEYVFVSLSLALVIAKFFPAIHSRLVSRATSLESQSLYWGTAVVSNAFVYGLILVYGRVISLFFVSEYHPPTIYIASIIQVVIYCLFLTISLFSTDSVKTATNVPIPKGMAKIMIYISFSFTCFCCICCSKDRKAKIMHVLVIFSLMTFTYHLIMEVIAVGFALLVNVSETITLIALCTLSLSFLVMFSYTIIVATSHWNDQPYYQQTLRITTSALTLVVIFGAMIFSILVYMLMLFKLQPEGVTAAVSTLLPPILLSVAGWYVKKKLLHVHVVTDHEEDYEDINSADEKGSITTEVSEIIISMNSFQKADKIETIV